jgi:gluconate 2-dehydrogenase alpha chain
VVAVETDSSGAHATGVRYLDARGQLQRVTADQVILALNAIETPRLLLTSTSAAHPDGLGNSSGLVGRYLMFHVIFESLGVFPQPIRSYRSREATHALSDFIHDDGSPNWIRGGYVELGGYIHPVTEGVQYPWVVHEQLFKTGTYRNHIAAASMIGQDVPVVTNAVDLDPTVRDVYGRPAPRITYARHPHDQAVVDAYLPKLTAIVQAAGSTSVLEIDDAKREGTYQTKHLMGTTRMGSDPTKAVCDPFGRLHDVDNVWIADAGCGRPRPASTPR